MFLGLRMNQGVSKSRFKKKFNKLIDEVFVETIKDLRCRGLIKEEGEFISLTERGKVIGNEVLKHFTKLIKVRNFSALTLTYFDQFDRL